MFENQPISYLRMWTENDNYVYVHSNVALWSVRRGTISLSLRRRLGENPQCLILLTSYIETHVHPIEVLAKCRRLGGNPQCLILLTSYIETHVQPIEVLARRRRLGGNPQCLILLTRYIETHVQPIEVLAMQIV